jgi:lambda family phage portal protein
MRGFYDSGNSDRLNAGWTPVNATAEQTDSPQRDIIRARARDLERNSDIAEAIIGPLERNVVGTGIKVQAKVKNADGTDDDELNQQIEDLWEEWCKPRNCDVAGLQSLAEMQRMAARRLEVDGGIIFVKAYTKGGTVPFSLQSREVDELDTAVNCLPGLGRNRVWNGIELDEYNKPLAYWLKKYTPDGFWTGQSERIEAKRIIFLWQKTRPTQIREMSPLAKTVPRVRDVNEFVEAVSVKERILACLSVFITKQTPAGVGRGVAAGRTDTQSGYKQQTVSPGMIKELQPGESVTAVTPSGQATSAKDFISTQQRLAGSGQGLSYEAVSRDMSQVNYSSARQGLLEDQRTYAIWQQFLINHFCEEVYTEFVISAVLSGQLSIPDFWQKKKKYLKHAWIPPGWSWIDPLKEVNANSKALATGQDTLARLCAERGEDWRDVLKQRAAEMKLAKELGLDISGGGNKNAEAQQQTHGGDTGA